MAELRQRLAARLSDRYAIGNELGRGGMAVVFLARDLRHGRDVALKVLRPEVGESLGADRFLREIRIVAGLTHPHVLPLHDSGEADGLFWFVMPYVRGESLRQRLLREGPLAVDEAVRIAGDVANGLAHAHAAGIIHRDIKPENILLEGGEAMLADFGIARAIDESTREGVSQAGLAVGTPHYMSPEQAEGRAHVDGRADVYSLGCVLYEMLTGAPPFSGPTARAILARHRKDPPPPVQTLRPDVPAPVVEALEKALQKVPADRYQSAAEFAGALDRARRAAPVVVAAPRSHVWAVRFLVLAAAVALAIVAARQPWRRPPMDPRRVALGPIEVVGLEAGGAVELDRGLTASLMTALATVPTLVPAEVYPWLPAGRRDDPRALSLRDYRRAARAAGAHWVAWGRVLLADSARLTLELYDAAGDSIAGRTMVASPLDLQQERGAITAAWHLGLGAVRGMLPRLIPAGGRDAPSALRALDPTPAAAASFLLGEIHYRAARYDSALAHFEEAVAQDSGFAMAAIRGAQAASWLKQTEEAAVLADLALARDSALPPRLQLFAEGLRDYFLGRADSAAGAFTRAVAQEPEWAEAWAALGEVYEHLLPSVARPDSAAEAAFATAHRLDGGLLPPTYHLAEALIRDGRLDAADSLVALYARTTDATQAETLRLMAACARGGNAAAGWPAAARVQWTAVFAAAEHLAAGGRSPGCLAGAWGALAADSLTPQPWRGFAQAGLMALDVALGDPGAAARRFRASDSLLTPSLRRLLPLLLVQVGVPLDAEADSVRAALERESGPAARDEPSPVYAWALAGRALVAGDLAAARQAHDELAGRAAMGDRLATLLRDAIAARLTLARGDTAAALARFRLLRPTAPHGALAWRPWESLVLERVELARLALARGDTALARVAAASYDGTAEPLNLLQLRPSLELRAGLPGAAGTEAERRLRALSRR